MGKSRIALILIIAFAVLFLLAYVGFTSYSEQKFMAWEGEVRGNPVKIVGYKTNPFASFLRIALFAFTTPTDIYPGDDYQILWDFIMNCHDMTCVPDYIFIHDAVLDTDVVLPLTDVIPEYDCGQWFLFDYQSTVPSDKPFGVYESWAELQKGYTKQCSASDKDYANVVILAGTTTVEVTQCDYYTGDKRCYAPGSKIVQWEYVTPEWDGCRVTWKNMELCDYQCSHGECIDSPTPVGRMEVTFLGALMVVSIIGIIATLGWVFI